MNHSQFQPVSDAELRMVEGGGILSWLGKVVDAVAGVLRCVNKTCA